MTTTSRSELRQTGRRIFLAIALGAALVALAVWIWGAVALTFSAMALVPVVFLFFVLVCWPFNPKD